MANWLNLRTFFSPHQQLYVSVYQLLHGSTVCMCVSVCWWHADIELSWCDRLQASYGLGDNHKWERYHAHTHTHTDTHTLSNTNTDWLMIKQEHLFLKCTKVMSVYICVKKALFSSTTDKICLCCENISICWNLIVENNSKVYSLADKISLHCLLPVGGKLIVRIQLNTK